MFSHYRYKENSCQKREAIPDKSRVSLTFLQKRTDSSNVTVAVAVAVPIGAIIIVLSVVLIVVYRRCKKEPSMQDLDPNFEGDFILFTEDGFFYEFCKTQTAMPQKRGLFMVVMTIFCNRQSKTHNLSKIM